MKVIDHSNCKIATPIPPSVSLPMVGNSNPVVATGTSSSQVSTQSAAMDTFTQFLTAKKWLLTSPGDVPIYTSPDEPKTRP